MSNLDKHERFVYIDIVNLIRFV